MTMAASIYLEINIVPGRRANGSETNSLNCTHKKCFVSEDIRRRLVWNSDGGDYYSYEIHLKTLFSVCSQGLHLIAPVSGVN